MSESPLKQLALALQELPVNLFSFVVGLLSAMIIDPILMALLFGSVAVGLQTNAIVAFAVFFLVYVTIRTINTVANAIGRLAQVNAQRDLIPVSSVLESSEPASEPVPPTN